MKWEYFEIHGASKNTLCTEEHGTEFSVSHTEKFYSLKDNCN